MNTVKSHQTEDLEAQKSTEKRDEKCDTKDHVPDTIAAGPVSSESPRPSIKTDSRDHASASTSDTENRNSADLDTGRVLQAPEGNSFRKELLAAVNFGCLNMPMPILFFEALATMNILVLQNDLGEVQKNITSAKISGEDKLQYAGRFEDLLHRYTTAIRDYDYMTGLDESFENRDRYLSILCENFPSSYSDKSTMEKLLEHGRIRTKNPPTRSIAPSDSLRWFLNWILPWKLTWTNEEMIKYLPGVVDLNELTPKMITPFVDRLARFIVAITGGLSLVVPMLIMRIHQSPNKSLITTSVAVVLFAGVVSVGFSASNAETLGITAAYAAVLVVFVGTSA